MEMSHISEKEKKRQTISFPCPLLFLLSVWSVLTEINETTPPWRCWKLILKYQTHKLQWWLSAVGGCDSLLFPQSSKWTMLTAHPVLDGAPMQHRYWSTTLCGHGGWPWKTIHEGYYKEAAKSVFTVLLLIKFLQHLHVESKSWSDRHACRLCFFIRMKIWLLWRVLMTLILEKKCYLRTGGHLSLLLPYLDWHS